MNDVFLDTVGLLAVWDTADQWHAAADAAYQELLKRGRRLLTTPWILLECGNAAAPRRAGHSSRSSSWMRASWRSTTIIRSWKAVTARSFASVEVPLRPAIWHMNRT